MAKLEQMGVEAIIKGLPQYLTGMDKMGKSTQKTQGIIGKIGGVAKGAIGGLLKLGVAAGGAAAAGIAAIGAISIKTAISVESAFAGVAKTTDGLIDEFGKMTEAGEEVFQSFRNLAKEVPIAVEELLAIGELAGQLGVPKEALVDFTETVAALGVTTNLTQEAAATALAQIANIFQISADDMAGNTQRVGSALVELGNNFATTEADILTFAQRIAGAGNIAGLTQADILGIGAAFSSVGIEAESGGTAVQKVLLAMVEAVTLGSDELEVFGRTVGLTAKEFADAFEKDAAGVLEQFVLGLGTAGDDAIGILGDLGLQDQRLARAFLSLSNAGDVLTRTMDSANDGFEENTALTEEAAKRYQTTESQMIIFKNTLRDVGITIGNILLPFLNKLLGSAKPLIEELGKRLPDFLNNFLIPTFQRIVDFLKVFLPEAFGRVQSFLQPIIDGVKNLFGAFSDSAPVAIEAIQSFISWFQENMVPVIQSITKKVGEILNSLAELWRKHGDKVITGLEFVFRIITTTVGGAVDLILSIVNGFLKILRGDWKGAWQGIKDALISILESALSIVGVDLDSFVNSWKGIWENIKLIVTTIWDSITGAIKEKVNGAITFVTDKFNELKQKLADILGIGSPSKVFRGFGEDMMAGLTEGILSSFKLPEAAITLAATKIIQPMVQVASPAAVSSSQTTTTNQNLTIHTSAPVEPIAADFRMMRAMKGRV